MADFESAMVQVEGALILILWASRRWEWKSQSPEVKGQFLVGVPAAPHRNENDTAGPWLNSKVGGNYRLPKGLIADLPNTLENTRLGNGLVTGR